MTKPQSEPTTPPEELERLRKIGEEIYESIRHKIGDEAARALIDFTLLAGQRLPAPMEIVEAFEKLSKGMSSSDAKAIINFIVEWAEWKHGLHLS